MGQRLSPSGPIDLIDLQHMLRLRVKRRARLEPVAVFRRGKQEQFPVEVGSELSTAGDGAIGIPEDHRITAEQTRRVLGRVRLKLAVFLGIAQQIDDSLIDERR